MYKREEGSWGSRDLEVPLLVLDSSVLASHVSLKIYVLVDSEFFLVY